MTMVRPPEIGPEVELYSGSLGDRISIEIRPHYLRRHSATYASRNGIPPEVISKILVRHQDLKTTQMYLGRISEAEALRWVDMLHGK